jgi:hypothetical protein
MSGSTPHRRRPFHPLAEAQYTPGVENATVKCPHCGKANRVQAGAAPAAALRAWLDRSLASA